MKNIAASYIATDRLHALALGAPLPEHTSGAALSTDMSGFTALTEVLAHQLGPARGSEEVTRYLNQTYEVLVRQVEGYGGSVISFSGDALLCWFDGDDGRLALAAALALHAALRDMGGPSLEGGLTYRPAFKTVVAAGRARRFLVGDPALQLVDVVAGEVTDLLSAIERLAESGEILLDRATAERLAPLLELRGWRSGPDGAPRAALIARLLAPPAPRPWPALDLEGLDVRQLRPWLMPEVFQRLEEGHSEFLTELRPVVALFVDFSGLDYLDDDAPATLDALVRRVQGLLSYYEGALLQLTTNARGGYLYLAFGAPIAHQDDVARALALAEQLREAMPTLPRQLGVRIGISKGSMCAGAYGGATRRIYGVLGDEVNVAARLMQHASPGQVLATRAVLHGAPRSFRWDGQRTLVVKGKQRPLQVYALLGAPAEPEERPTPPWASPVMVGRERELERLLRAVEELEAGQGSVVVVEGDAGVGKSHLVARLVAQGAARGVTFLIGAATALERATPYYVWRAILGQLLQLGSSSGELRRGLVFRALAAQPELARLAPLLNPLLGLDLPETETTAHMSHVARIDTTRELVIELLRAAQQPHVILVEDAHWLDSVSWALLQSVAQHVPRLLLVLVTRPLDVALPEPYQQLLAIPATERLRLGELDRRETRQLLLAKFGLASLPEELLDLVYMRAQGNPLFSEELLHSFVDSGMVAVQGQSCQIVSRELLLSPHELPATVQGVITSRIDRFPPADQLALKVASVIGRSFAFRPLYDIYPLAQARPHLAATLTTLERRDITLCSSPEPELHYRFKHVIFQEVSYNLMSFAQRRELHRAVAEWYEEVYQQDLAPLYPLLAYHWRRAEDHARTLDYLERAGVQALQSGAYLEAVAFLSEALRLEADDPPAGGTLTRARWERLLGEAYYNLGQTREAYLHLERSLRLLGWSMPRTTGRLALGIARDLLLQLLHRLRPAYFLGRARSREPFLLEAIRAYIRISKIHYVANETLQAIHASVRALNLTEQAGISAELAESYASSSITAGVVGLVGLADFYSRRALAVAEHVGEPRILATALQMTSIYTLSMGRWAETSDNLNRALELFEQQRARRQWDETTAFLGALYFHQGEFAASASTFATLERSVHVRGDQQGQSWLLNGLARYALRTGDLARAEDLLRQALLLQEGTSDPTEQIMNYGLLALVQLYSARYEEATHAAQQALAIMCATSPTVVTTLEGYASVAETYLALWERALDRGATARHMAAQARTACNALRMFARPFPIARPRALLLHGRWLWLAGRRTQAQQVWQRALAQAKHLQMPYDQALVHYQLGLRSAEPERRLQLAVAQAIFAELGAGYQLALAKAAAASTAPD